jgi:hypothetical protein
MEGASHMHPEGLYRTFDTLDREAIYVDLEYVMRRESARTYRMCRRLYPSATDAGAPGSSRGDSGAGTAAVDHACLWACVLYVKIGHLPSVSL